MTDLDDLLDPPQGDYLEPLEKLLGISDDDDEGDEEDDA